MKALFTIVIIVALLLVFTHLFVKETGSDKISKAVKDILEREDIGLQYDELTIDLLASKAEITNLFIPLPLVEGITGTISAKLAEIDFSMKDAAGFLFGNPTLTSSTIAITDTQLKTDGNIPLSGSIEKLSLEFKGSLPINELGNGDIKKILYSKKSDEEQVFIVRLNNLSFNSYENSLLPAFLSGLSSRSVPISGFEIAFLTSAVFPNIPITKEFLSILSEGPVEIPPEKFAHVADLVTKLLGIGREKSLISDGVVTARAQNDAIIIAGEVRNEIGNFSVSGIGDLNASDIAMSEVQNLSVTVTELDSVLAEIIDDEKISVTLQAPIPLKQLISGVFTFDKDKEL